MDKPTLREDEQRTAHEAAEWLDRLAPGTTEEYRVKDFADWLSRSPVHVQEFLTMTAIDRYLNHIPRDYPLDLAKLRAVALKAVPFATKTSKASQTGIWPLRSARSRGFWPSLLAAAALIVATIAAWWIHSSAGQRYITGIGEQRAVELLDGSVVYLDARSKIDIRLTQSARDVYLTEGEALFKVKHEATRPFRVHAQQAVIQAVGTAFNVCRRDRQTTIAVLEGAVRISSATAPAGAIATNSLSASAASALTAGEEAQVAATGQISVRHNIDVAKTMAWRERRLVFDKTFLPEIAAEFNRYNRSPQLRIEGGNAQRRRFTGAFDADDPESLVALLQKDPQLQVEQREGWVVIR